MAGGHGHGHGGGGESHGHGGRGGGGLLEFFVNMFDHEIAEPLADTAKKAVESGSEFAGKSKGGGGGHGHH